MTATPTIERAIDAAPWSGALGLTLLLCGLVMTVDGFDLAAMPMTVPHVAHALGLAPAGFGPALAAVLIGMGAGAVMLAPIGDRIGRRPVAIMHLLLIGAATIATASASTLGGFVGWRLLTGLGLGGCLPNITALTAEISPQRMRARTMTITGVGVSLGGFVAGLVVPPLVAQGGWRAPFLAAGALTLGLALLLIASLPESPKFLAGRRSGGSALARLAGRLRLADTAAFAPSTSVTPRVPLLALFGPRFRLATTVFVGVYLLNSLNLYMLSSWLPTVLPRAGFSLGQAARLAGIMQAGGFAGGLLIALLLDRGRAAVALAGAYACVLVALVAFTILPPQGPLWAALLLVVGGGIAGAHMALMAVAASLYPAAVLTSAIGFAVAVARIGAVGGPFVGQALVAANVSAPGFLLAAVPAVLLCLGGLAFLPRAERRAALVDDL